MLCRQTALLIKIQRRHMTRGQIDHTWIYSRTPVPYGVGYPP
jgi:hypothetical protein